jgi:peptidyl-prolyl cis-trans isomerase D
MLDSIRKRKDNLIYTILILAVVAVMAFYGVGQLGKAGQGGDVAAWVNGDLISQSELEDEVSRQVYQLKSMFGAQFDPRMLDQYDIPKHTLDQLIQKKLIQQQASKMDIVVPDAELASHIRSLPYYQKDGKFSPELYKQGGPKGPEEKLQRQQLQVQKFVQYIGDRVRLSPTELRQAYLMKETKVDLEYAKFDFPTLAAQHKATPSQVDDYVKSTPEADLKAYYTKHQREYTDPAQVQLRQIRVNVPFQAKDAQKAEAKKKIETAAKDLTAKNFADVAKKISDDEYAKKGGEVGWVNRGTLEPALEASLESLPLNTVSKPIETAFGYFLLLAEGKKEAVTHPFDKVKWTIAEKLVGEKLSQSFIDEKRKLWNKMLAEGKSIDGELKALKIETKKTGPFAIGQGQIPSIGAADAILDAVFLLTKEKPIAPQLYDYQGQTYFIKLASMQPAKTSEFAKNADVVEKSLTTSLQSQILSEWIKTLEKSSTVKQEVKFSSKDSPVAVD